MAGVKTLIALILRRDRVKLPLWIAGLVLSLLSMIPLLRDIYGSEEELTMMYSTLGSNPAILFLTGPMDAPTFGAFMTLETLLWWGLAIAFVNTMLVVRHTRHNEEIGAQELILSGQVHRSASLAAALIVALGVNGLIVLGLGLGMSAIDPGWSAEQSWLYAAAMGCLGLVWASIAAIVVQLVESARSANGVLAGLIGLSFLLRGIGDFLGQVDESGLHQPVWVSSLSPFGWAQATRPLTDYSWEPLIVMLGFSVLAACFSFWLLARRDVDAGLLPSRSGKTTASKILATPIGLVLYLQKNIFVGWFVAILAMAVTIGVLTPQMSDIYSGSDSMRQMIEAIGGVGDLLLSFISAMLAIISLLVFAYVVHGLSKLRAEESSGHLESLLALPLSRMAWIGLHFLVVILGGVAMLVVIGLILPMLVNILSEYSLDIWQYLGASLSYAPIMLAFAGLYIVLFGLLPRMVNWVVWLYFGFVAFVSWLGPIVQLNDFVMKLSIMEHFASPPVEGVQLLPIVITLIVSIFVIVVGVVVWRQRDLLEK